MVTERFSIDEINTATGALAAGKIKGRAILIFD
jgi:D-arabinose 1-dehydrogenase-like Zn-dependent alcohol dehydrogenase